MKRRIAKKLGVSKYPETRKQLAAANIKLRKELRDLEDNYRDSKANATYLAGELGKCKEASERNKGLLEEMEIKISNQEELLKEKDKKYEELKSKYRECSKLANDFMAENSELEYERKDAEQKCDKLIEENYKLKQELEYARLPWFKKVFNR